MSIDLRGDVLEVDVGGKGVPGLSVVVLHRLGSRIGVELNEVLMILALMVAYSLPVESTFGGAGGKLRSPVFVGEPPITKNSNQDTII